MLLLVAAATLALGPLLTLIATRARALGDASRPQVTGADLAVILLLQLTALMLSGAPLYRDRPAFLVFGVDRFTVVPAAAVDGAELRDPELKPPLIGGPRLAEARPPQDPERRQELLFAVLLDGAPDLEWRPELYEPYRPDLAALRARSIDLAGLAMLDEQARRAIDAFAARHRLEDYLYLPLRGKRRDLILALSATDGLPAGWIPISPWAEDYGKWP